ncbi:reverse transcriptase zinc-binding domain-containing protein [Tanacetum coccineum]
MRNCLRTQDKLRQWNIGYDTDSNLITCPFCGVEPDSHNHLFFECGFSSQVWIYIRPLENMEAVNPTLHDILSHLQPMAKYQTTNSIIGKLLLAATSYYIWIECNNRLFRNVKRAPEEIRDIIMVIVRLKLLAFRFKNTIVVTRMLELW